MHVHVCCFFFKQKTADDMRISDWSSDVCSSDLDIQIPAIEIAGLAKRYASRSGGTVALRDVSLTVGRHEFVCIVGPSGCGKSTLLKIISGIEPPSDGLVRRFGEVVTEPTPDIGMVFQAPEIGRAHVCTPVNNAQPV